MQIELSKQEQVIVGVVNLMLSGYKLKEVSDMLHISKRTLEAQFGKLYTKFKVKRFDHLCGKLIKAGLVTPESIKKVTIEDDALNSQNVCNHSRVGIMRTMEKTIFYL